MEIDSDIPSDYAEEDWYVIRDDEEDCIEGCNPVLFQFLLQAATALGLIVPLGQYPPKWTGQMVRCRTLKEVSDKVSAAMGSTRRLG
jgi:hypothetical protein